eukprot:765566-Hanusia_phi.AAC.6
MRSPEVPLHPQASAASSRPLPSSSSVPSSRCSSSLLQQPAGHPPPASRPSRSPVRRSPFRTSGTQRSPSPGCCSRA